MKEARSSAQAEIEAYKASKEAEFKKFEDDVCTLFLIARYAAADAHQHSGVHSQAEKDAIKEVQQTLNEIEQLGKKKAPKVVEDLLKAVTDVKPEQHRNAATTA